MLSLGDNRALLIAAPAEVEASASASGAADKGKKKNEQLPTKEATPPPTLRPLHSLRWPEEPEEKIFDDALSRNDPKPLRRSEVFSIATNKDIRRLFTTYPNLRSVLARLDSIEIDGSRSREIIIQRVLGYDGNTLSGKSIHGLPSQLSNLQESDREALQALMQCMNNSIEACNSSSK